MTSAQETWRARIAATSATASILTMSDIAAAPVPRAPRP